MASNQGTQECLEKTFVVFQLLSAKSSLTLYDSMDMNLCKLQETVENSGACHGAVHGVIKSQTRLST